MKRLATMEVCIRVYLTRPPEQKHQDEMQKAAMMITKDKKSIWISIVTDENALLARFTIPVAREMDVVDKIGRTFSLDMEDYSTQTIWFPKRNKTPTRT